MSNALVNKVATAKFFTSQGIPAREAIFAAVMLGDGGIGVREVADAFADGEAPYFETVAFALREAEVRAAKPVVLASAAR